MTSELPSPVACQCSLGLTFLPLRLCLSVSRSSVSPLSWAPLLLSPEVGLSRVQLSVSFCRLSLEGAMNSREVRCCPYSRALDLQPGPPSNLLESARLSRN